MPALVRESQVKINWDMLSLSIGLRVKQLLMLILPLWHPSLKVSSPQVIFSVKVGQSFNKNVETQRKKNLKWKGF